MQNNTSEKSGRLLILGAGIYQVPLIDTARRMGLETIVLSVDGNYPGIALADRFLPIDTTDVPSVVAVAEEFGVDGVATAGTDTAVPAIGAVVDRLGLAGTGYEASVKCMDKALMKEALTRHGLPTAEFSIVNTYDEAREAAQRHRFPLMVKAVDSSGSRGITRVSGPAGLRAAWDLTQRVSRAQNVIVEQELVGVEFGAQVIVHGQDVVASFIHNDVVLTSLCPTPIGHSMPASLSPEIEKATAEVMERAIEALGIRDTVVNFDLMLVGGKPVIIEVGARAGATGLPEIVAAHSGLNVYQQLIRLALGERERIVVREARASAGLLLRSSTTGTVTRLDVPDNVRTHPQVEQLRLDVGPGDRVRKFSVGPDRVGDIVVTGDSVEGAESLARDLIDSITIEVGECA